jgi:hypothetical protein
LLLGQPVQAVVLADDGSGDGIGRLREAVSAVMLCAIGLDLGISARIDFAKV